LEAYKGELFGSFVKYIPFNSQDISKAEVDNFAKEEAANNAVLTTVDDKATKEAIEEISDTADLKPNTAPTEKDMSHMTTNKPVTTTDQEKMAQDMTEYSQEAMDDHIETVSQRIDTVKKAETEHTLLVNSAS
jgi:hypothetical protein